MSSLRQHPQTWAILSNISLIGKEMAVRTFPPGVLQPGRRPGPQREVIRSRQEPGALNLHAGIRAGGVG